jgi:hypothetical protein
VTPRRERLQCHRCSLRLLVLARRDRASLCGISHREKRGAPCRLRMAMSELPMGARHTALGRSDAVRSAAISPVSPTFDRLSNAGAGATSPGYEPSGPTPVTPRRDLGFKTLAPEDHAVVRELTDRIAEVSELAPHGPTRRIGPRLTGRPDRGGANTRGTAVDAPRPAWGRD